MQRHKLVDIKGWNLGSELVEKKIVLLYSAGRHFLQGTRLWWTTAIGPLRKSLGGQQKRCRMRTRTSPVDVPDQADLFSSSCSDFNDQLRKFVPVVTLLLPVHVWRSPQTVIYILIARRDNSGGRTLHKKPLLVDAVGSSYLNSQFVHDLDLLRIFNHILISVHHHKQRSPEFIAITGLWWRRPLDLICSVLKASFPTTGWQKALLPSEDFCSRK